MAKKLTFDTNIKPNANVVSLARSDGWEIAYATVSVREAQSSDFQVKLLAEDLISEIGVWDDSSWDHARWADDNSSKNLEEILEIISNGSFPKHRSNLSKGETHQLRDAMILEAHSNAKRDVFVSGDIKAFVKDCRREKLQSLLNTKILTELELEAKLSGIDC